MERELFEAVRQKSLAQWSHRTVVRNKSDQLLTGLLFDDAGHRMIPTHATKAGIRYRYYASTPVLHGEPRPRQPDRSPAFPLPTLRTSS
jgi:site-specific DNA recombinase